MLPTQESHPTEAPSGAVRTPGEYEPLYGALVRWRDYSWYELQLTELVVGITTDPNTNSLAFVIVDHADMQSVLISLLQLAGANINRVRFIIYDEYGGDALVWIRDYGPRYIYEDGLPAIIDHTYHGTANNAFPAWLSTYELPFDDNEPVYEMDLTHHGGNLLCTSTGDAFMTTGIMLQNPDKNEPDIRGIIESHFNVSLTLYDMLPFSGHIDMWLLPLSDNKIIVSEFPLDHPQSKTITDNAAADLQSRGYTVYRTPAHVEPGEDEPWGVHYTYTNAAIVNGRVFIPSYDEPNEDAAALATYQAALPDHEVIQIYCGNMIDDGGALHCITKPIYTILGDFDKDGDVDMVDFAIFASAWFTEEGDGKWNRDCNIALPKDAIIDGLDLAVFVGNWLIGK
ncbi:MAG: agmatine deiminase family protein [Planctomycetota bacterium]|jgi:agmatine deiminase